MGMFDELVPKKSEEQPKGMFDDLVPQKKPSTMSDVGTGVKAALLEPVYGIGEMIPGVSEKASKAAKELEQEYQAAAKRSPIATRAGYIPTTIATLLTPGIAGKALGYVPKIAEATSAAGKIGTAAREGALTGAVYGAIEPTGAVDPYEIAKQKALHSLTGGAIGGVTGGVVGGVTAAVPEIAKAAVGVPSKAAEEIVAPFEARGYKLEPMQMTRDEPSYSPGFMKNKVTNQNLANQDASKATGKLADEKGITDTFLNERFKTLGNDYDKIYNKEKSFLIDAKTLQELKSIAMAEAEIAPGQARTASQGAINLINKIETEGNLVNSKFLGDVLSELKKDVRSAQGREKNIISDVISSIDGSLIRNHPTVAKELSDLNKKYKATIILDDLAAGKTPGIKNGDISLRQLGANIDRLKGTDLYELGRFGRASNMSARWEGAGAGAKPLPESILSPTRLARALATGAGLRSQTARRIQKKLED